VVASAPAACLPRQAARWREWLAAAIVVAAMLAAYANSFQGVFVFDDLPSIIGNPSIRQLWPIAGVLQPPRNGETVSGRPLLNLSLAANYAMAAHDAQNGTAVWGYHAVNLAIHVLCALLLFAVVRQTLFRTGTEDWGLEIGKSPNSGTPIPNPQSPVPPKPAYAATLLAFAIALLWAVHPLQTESVTYIVQRAESLAGLFYLLTLYCTIRGATSSKPAGWFVAAVLACLMGMATKETMVTAPLLVLLYDRTFLAGSWRQAMRRRWALYLGLAATWALLAYLVVSTGLWGRNAGYGAAEAVPAWDYLRSQPVVILHYLRLACWPAPLCLDYGPTALVTNATKALVAALVVGSLLAFTAWGIVRRKPWAMLGAGLFLILAPSSLLPLRDVAFEHRMYLPLAAVVAAMVLGGYGLCRRAERNWPGTAMAGKLLVVIAAVGLAIVTFQRNKDYRSQLSIWQDVVKKLPGNPRAHNNLGVILADQKRLDEAMAHWRRALELDGRFGEAYNNLGNAFSQQEKFDEAIANYQKAVAFNPRCAETYYNLGLAFQKQGRTADCLAAWKKAFAINPGYAAAYVGALYNHGVVLQQQGNLEEAAACYTQALAIRPQHALAHNALGGILYRQGHVDAAIAHCRKALEIAPELATAHNNLANILSGQERLDEAITHYQRALVSNPALADVHMNLGLALYRLGRPQEALAQWREMLQRQPRAIPLLNLTAWVLATSPDSAARNGAEAVVLARRAVEVSSGQDPALLDTLAAAYAEAKRFPEAIDTARRAQRLAAAMANRELAESIARRIQGYLAGKAFRDSRPPAAILARP
jgi:tetratricopeptide (TPR) repeat protein